MTPTISSLINSSRDADQLWKNIVAAREIGTGKVIVDWLRNRLIQEIIKEEHIDDDLCIAILKRFYERVQPPDDPITYSMLYTTSKRSARVFVVMYDFGWERGTTTWTHVWHLMLQRWFVDRVEKLRFVLTKLEYVSGNALYHPEFFKNATVEQQECLALIFLYTPLFQLFFVKPDIPLDLLREVYNLT